VHLTLGKPIKRFNKQQSLNGLRSDCSVMQRRRDRFSKQ